jgi:hypothetical protein
MKIGNRSVSHHHPFHLVTGSKQTTNTYQRTGLKWNTTKIDEYQFKIGNIKPSDCRSFTDNIIKVAEQLNMKITQKTGKPWFDSQCNSKRRIVLQKLQDSRTAARSKESCLAYYNERKEYKVLLREKKKAHYDSQRETINNSRNQFWKAIKSLRARTAPDLIPEESWKVFYDDISLPIQDFYPVHGASDECLDCAITENELNEALKKSKANKAPGQDGILSEF